MINLSLKWHNLRKYIQTVKNNIRNQIVPEFIFKLNNNLYFKQIFSNIYGRYLIFRYKDNYCYWFNHLFANDFLFKEHHNTYPIRYSYFLFALFAVNSFYLRKTIYQLYGTQMYYHINIGNKNTHIEQYIVYLYFFDIFLPVDTFIMLLQYLYSCTLFASPWQKERFNAYCTIALRCIDLFPLLSAEEKLKVGSTIMTLLL